MFFVPLLSVGQILHSKTFPFQNITDPENYNKLYDLLLAQELFVDLELSKYIRDHKTIALLPVNFIYTATKHDMSNEELNKLQQSISECIYNEFIADLHSYSSQHTNIKNAVKKNNHSSYVPQTQQNKYLENQQYQDAGKRVVNLQKLQETHEKLNRLGLTNLIYYSPEFLCNILNVDALFFINIHSDTLLPIKNCLSFEKRHANLKSTKTQAFISLYDNSGKLLWLYGKDHPKTPLFNNKSNSLYSVSFRVGSLFPNVFDNFPYLIQ